MVQPSLLLGSFLMTGAVLGCRILAFVQNGYVKWLPPQFMTISGIHSLPVTWTRAKTQDDESHF